MDYKCVRLMENTLVVSLTCKTELTLLDTLRNLSHVTLDSATHYRILGGIMRKLLPTIRGEILFLKMALGINIYFIRFLIANA